MAATNSVKAFNQRIRRWAADKVPAEVVALHKRLSLEVFSRITTKTPVDTGRARGNWQLSIGSPIKTETTTLDDTPTGQESGQAMTSALMQLGSLAPFGQVWITNNLPYISALEHGSSDQAAGGMVAVTLAELDSLSI